MVRRGIRGRRWGWMGRLGFGLFMLLVGAPVLALLVFRFLPLPGTPQMLVSLIEGKGAHYAWSESIAPALGRTVIGSEDQRFCSHHGFDWQSIDQVMAAHRRHPDQPMRGLHTPTFDIDETALAIGAGVMACAAVGELQ